MINAICPHCAREWPQISEQAIAIEIGGHCIACHREHEPWEPSIWRKIIDTQRERRFEAIATGVNAFISSLKEEQEGVE